MQLMELENNEHKRLTTGAGNAIVMLILASSRVINNSCIVGLIME